MGRHDEEPKFVYSNSNDMLKVGGGRKFYRVSHFELGNFNRFLYKDGKIWNSADISSENLEIVKEY